MHAMLRHSWAEWRLADASQIKTEQKQKPIPMSIYLWLTFYEWEMTLVVIRQRESTEKSN